MNHAEKDIELIEKYFEDGLSEFDAGSMLVDEVKVYASKLGPEGPTYDVLARAPLAE